MNTSTLMVVLPTIMVSLVLGLLYVRARRIEYKLAMNRLQRMEISREAQSSSSVFSPEFLGFVRCLRTIQATVIFRRLIKTGVQHRVLDKVLQDYGRRFGLSASLILEAFQLVSPPVEGWLLRNQTKSQRWTATLKALFIPERFE